METGQYLIPTLSDDEAIFTSNGHRAGGSKSGVSVDVDDDAAVIIFNSAGVGRHPVSSTFNGTSDQVVQGGIDSIQSNTGAVVQVYSNHAGLHDVRVYRVGTNLSYHSHKKNALGEHLTSCGKGWTSCMSADEAVQLKLKPCQRCYPTLPGNDVNPAITPSDQAGTALTNTTQSTRNAIDISGAQDSTDTSLFKYKIGKGKSYHRKLSVNDSGVACGQRGGTAAVRFFDAMKPCSNCYDIASIEEQSIAYPDTRAHRSRNNLSIAVKNKGVQDIALAKYRIGRGNTYHRKLTIDSQGVVCGQRGSKAPVQVTSMGAMKPCSKCYYVNFIESQSTSNPSTQALIASNGTISTLTNTELTSGLVRNTQSSDRNPLQVSNAYPSTRSSTNSREPTGVVGDNSFANGVMAVHDVASVIYSIGKGKPYHRKVSINDDGVTCGSTGSTLPIEVTSTGTMKPCSECYPSSVSTTSSITYPNTRAHSARAAAISASTVEGADQSVQVHVPVLPEWTDSYPNTRSRQATRATVVNAENNQVALNTSGRDVVELNIAEARYKIGNGKKYHRKVDSDASGVACGQKGTTPPTLVSSVDAMTPCAKCYK
ncbi:hypothetical protein SARC_06370 [Sphaeroforma arctica JP610]|uniref:Uncharacterized protein n=1 Tax=Sphaeroforma arctica JP610 TaxID=667725 RepID=A0A0L0FWS7_9EUKA|nr:hypothetical protein SARC_06370 [Sphaeroforma arctica JP610]KNC81300.1 hypothetical protein SARC_06370 [Sphaeroforma arctica JP610]|eukprot:XP_014155202.1 hypothetical protein SARC_06370 [Sphaeroforma arctica JP610]